MRPCLTALQANIYFYDNIEMEKAFHANVFMTLLSRVAPGTYLAEIQLENKRKSTKTKKLSLHKSCVSV